MPDTSPETLELLAEITTRNLFASGHTKNEPVTTLSPDSQAINANRVVKEGSTAKRRADNRKQKEKRFKEPNINRRVDSEGKTSFTVQIRRTIDGKQYSLSKTFKNLQNAKIWRDKKLLEIETTGFPIQIISTTTVAEVIQKRLDKGKELGRSAQQVLKYIQAHEFGKSKVATLKQHDLVDFAELLLTDERSPQTVAGYMVNLSATLKWAKRRGSEIPVSEVIDAMEVLWEDEILARSAERDRRPSLVELDKILSAAYSNNNQKIPVIKLVAFAIFSSRRLGEICRLRWDDINTVDRKILVREMKHPRKKKKNDVWCDLTPEAMEIIRSMPREDERIFPFNPRSVGAAFRRNRDKVSISDLRFHDLRHEAISRLSETGMQAEFVAKISGHKGASCLERYTHVAKRGDKYDGWKWLDIAIQS